MRILFILVLGFCKSLQLASKNLNYFKIFGFSRLYGRTKPKLIDLSQMAVPGIGLDIPQSSHQVMFGKPPSVQLWSEGASIKMELVPRC